MAGNLYEMIATRNGELAKFFDENHNMALLVKKLVGVVASIAHEWHVDASQITFEPIASPDGRMIVIRLKRP